MWNWFANNWHYVISALTALASLIFILINIVGTLKKAKTATTAEQKKALMEELKADVLGLINVAEDLFVDISKSGSTKLMYVLSHVENLCKATGVDYSEEYWTEFINKVIGKSNQVKSEKELESTVNALIEKVKTEVSHFIATADRLFLTIPDNVDYKVDYVVRKVAEYCQGLSVNVFDMYDWKSYIEDVYESKGVIL